MNGGKLSRCERDRRKPYFHERAELHILAFDYLDPEVLPLAVS
jgi:hypothetical protein